jgi:DNA-binding NarL/FixJ family response regulator
VALGLDLTPAAALARGFEMAAPDRLPGTQRDHPRSVVILTTSQAQQDVLRSYALHANAYVSKPVDFERFMDVIRQIDNFFITVVKLAR